MHHVFSFRKPDDASIRRVLEDQRNRPFTYSEVGAIERGVPSGYLRNGVRTRLGQGETLFESAVDALLRWKQFDVGWVEVCWPSTTPTVGEVIGVLARACGVWALSVSRILDVIDESTDAGRRFAVIYGTLPQHVETGEERFQIEWRRDDESVWYDVQAFYRPYHPLVRAAWPLVRRYPRRFVRQSADAMRRACESASDQAKTKIRSAGA